MGYREDQIEVTRGEGRVHEALRIIVANSDKKALNYCVNYARAGLHMYGRELHLQVLHVLDNMTHWRGEEAVKVRGILKEYTK